VILPNKNEIINVVGGATETLYDVYQIMPNKTIRDLNGDRFVSTGINAFERLFFSNYSNDIDTHADDDYTYRTGYGVSGKGAGTGISEPTYYAPYRYGTSVYRQAEYARYASWGINTIQIRLEPAVMYTTVSYTDPKDSLVYPSDPDMLDTIVAEVTELGFVCELVIMRGESPPELRADFLRWMCARYYENPRVWLGTQNEILNKSVVRPKTTAQWILEQDMCVAACREDIPGQPTGTKFLGPVFIDAYKIKRVNEVHSLIQASSTLMNDPNLGIHVHYYPNRTKSTFLGTQLTDTMTYWGDYTQDYCILVNETGVAVGINVIPYVNGEGANPTYWSNIKSQMIEFLTWCDQMTINGPISGVHPYTLGFYVAGLSIWSRNSTHIYDEFGQYSWETEWGEIFLDYYASRNSVGRTFPLIG